MAPSSQELGPPGNPVRFNLANRRQVLGDLAFKHAMLEEIGARIETLARMRSDVGRTCVFRPARISWGNL